MGPCIEIVVVVVGFVDSDHYLSILDCVCSGTVLVWYNQTYRI